MARSLARSHRRSGACAPHLASRGPADHIRGNPSARDARGRRPVVERIGPESLVIARESGRGGPAGGAAGDPG